MSEVTLTKDNFDKEILEAKTVALVDFWAEWCGPCKVLGPIVEEIANDYKGKVVVGKANVDNNNELASKYGIMSIPTLKFFKDGKVVGELVGAAPKETIEKELKKHL